VVIRRPLSPADKVSSARVVGNRAGAVLSIAARTIHLSPSGSNAPVDRGPPGRFEASQGKSARGQIRCDSLDAVAGRAITAADIAKRAENRSQENR
jgi:hypothetical protein